MILEDTLVRCVVLTSRIKTATLAESVSDLSRDPELETYGEVQHI
jgi:hypothetical protein